MQTQRHIAALFAGLALTALGTTQGEGLSTKPPEEVQTGGKGEGVIPDSKPLPPPFYQLRDGHILEVSFKRDGTLQDRKIPGAEHARLRAAGTIPPLHASRAIRLSVSVEPETLAPGESGAIRIAARSRADLALRKAANPTFRPTQAPAALRTGLLSASASNSAASNSGGAKRLDLRLPITIAPRTPHGELLLVGEIDLDVYAAKNGELVGRLTTPLRAKITVGKSTKALRDRIEQLRKPGPKSDSTPTDETGSPSIGDPSTAGASPTASSANPAAVPDDAPITSEVTPDEGGELQWQYFLAAAAGAILLAVVLRRALRA